MRLSAEEFKGLEEMACSKEAQVILQMAVLKSIVADLREFRLHDRLLRNAMDDFEQEFRGKIRDAKASGHRGAFTLGSDKDRS